MYLFLKYFLVFLVGFVAGVAVSPDSTEMEEPEPEAVAKPVVGLAGNSLFRAAAGARSQSKEIE